MKRAKRGWRGYIFSRPILGSSVPQRVQNLVVRSYAERHNLHFLLSAVEYRMDGCAMMLESLYAELRGLEGLLFYSMNMLPGSRAVRRRLYDEVLKAGCGLRFALEELSIGKRSDIGLIEDALACRELSEGLTEEEISVRLRA